MEIAEGDAWPAPPQPCGVIAGTRALALANPTSWLTHSCGLLDGAARPPCRLPALSSRRSDELDWRQVNYVPNSTPSLDTLHDRRMPRFDPKPAWQGHVLFIAHEPKDIRSWQGFMEQCCAAVANDMWLCNPCLPVGREIPSLDGQDFELQ